MRTENGRVESAVVSLWNHPGVTFFQRALLIIIIEPGMPSRPECVLLSRERVSKNAEIRPQIRELRKRKRRFNKALLRRCICFPFVG